MHQPLAFIYLEPVVRHPIPAKARLKKDSDHWLVTVGQAKGRPAGSDWAGGHWSSTQHAGGESGPMGRGPTRGGGLGGLGLACSCQAGLGVARAVKLHKLLLFSHPCKGRIG